MRIVALLAATALALIAAEPPPPLPDLRFASSAGGRNVYTGDRWSYMEAAGPAGAPVIVLLHGVGANSMDWRFQFGPLSARFRVIAWNAPGYLLSDGFTVDQPGCLEYANALADFLDALALRNVFLVGNSFGSRVVQCFAMHHLGRARKIALVGPSAGRSGIPAAERAQTLASREAMIAGGGYAFGERVDALLGPKTSPALRALAQNTLRATNRRGYLHGIHLLVSEGYAPAEVAAKVKVPVLLIAGSADKVSPVDTNAALLHRALAGSRLEILPDIGHLPFFEAPETVNRLLTEFFSAP